MTTLIAYHVRAMLRNRSILIWSLAFPIILATCFSIMFQGFSTNAKATGIELGVVADAAYERAAGLKEALAGLSNGEGAMLALAGFADEPEADEALLSGDIVAYVTADADGLPALHMPPSGSEGVSQAIVRAVMDRYVQGAAAGALLAEEVAGNGGVAADAGSQAAPIVTMRELDILRVAPSEFARYYYAVLAYACIVGSQTAVLLVTRVRTRDTQEGLRCQVAAAAPARQLGAAFCAGWLVNVLCLLAAFAYIRFVLNVPFGGREVLVPLVLAVCSCVSCALGSLVGALPRLSLDTKETVVSVSTLVLCIPAGLFGTPAMELSNWLSLHMPWVQAVNPAFQVSQAFLSLTYYDSLAPFAATLAALLGIAVALFALAALLMRRQRYAYL